ncbi:MAG TPA: exopolysaccharide biosynthesis protein [Gammaproteobacteria bacterium]|nr:exopolysaccharide biosynthesis protein [Gammaproteobacteria bacterium]
MSIVEKAIQKRRERLGKADVTLAEKEELASNPERESVPTQADAKERSSQREETQSRSTELPRITIDVERLRQFGLVPPEDYAERVANEYRSIKRPLLDKLGQAGDNKMPRARLLNRLVVTSSVPGEGKTFTAINLAFSLARERDYKVVLIDGDVLKPRATEAFGLQDKRGFGDLLADESLSVESALFESDVDSLWVMPAGRRDPLLAEHLSSRRADQVLAHVARLRPAQILVIDSPPLLPTAEAPLLAARAGQVVMVIRAGATAQHTLRLALGSLREDHEVSLLLNQTELPRWQDYYSQYSGYYARSTSE